MSDSPRASAAASLQQPTVALQDYLEQRITMEVARLREAIETHVTHVREGSTADKMELARRLDILNHAHEEAQRVLNTYVPRTVFEIKQDLVDTRLAEIDVWRGRIIAFVFGLAVGAGAAAGGLVGAIVRIF